MRGVAVHPQINALCHLGRLIVIGFMTMVLIGPVLGVLAALLWLIVTLLSIFLPFAVIGFLVWLPYRLLSGRGSAVNETKLFVKGTFQALVAAPVRLLLWLPALARMGLQKTWSAGRRVGGILLETGCGAMLGGGLGWLTAAHFSTRERVFYVLGGVLAGAVFGLLVGLINHLPSFRGQGSSC
jgi:hypothetical protein